MTVQTTTTERYSKFINELYSLLIKKETFKKGELTTKHGIKGCVYAALTDDGAVMSVAKCAMHPMGLQFNEERLSAHKYGSKFYFFELAKKIHKDCNELANSKRRFPRTQSSRGTCNPTQESVASIDVADTPIDVHSPLETTLLQPQVVKTVNLALDIPTAQALMLMLQENKNPLFTQFNEKLSTQIFEQLY